MAHSNRIIAEGTDLWMFLETGTTTKTYRPFSGQTACQISDDSDQLESTCKNAGQFANYQYGRERWSATLDMLIASDTNAAEVDFAEVARMRKAKYRPIIFMAFVDADGEIDTTRPAYRGQVILKTPIGANDGELQKASITMQGCLELEYLEYVTSAWQKIAATYPPA